MVNFPHERETLCFGTWGEDEDFFTLKGAVEAVLKELRIEDVSFKAEKENPSYHPGRCAAIYCGDEKVGVMGQIHPLVAQRYGVDCEMLAAEISVAGITAHRAPLQQYVALPKYPSVMRDLAVLCRKEITVAQLEETIRKGAKGLLKKVELFDIYTGDRIPDNMKSVAFSLQLRAEDRNLTAAEADEDIRNILETLKADLDAVLR